MMFRAGLRAFAGRQQLAGGASRSLARRTRHGSTTKSSIKGGRDLFGHKGQSETYAIARPKYPDAALAFAVGEAGDSQRDERAAKTVAVDVATGTGQLAVPLGRIFDRVVACDVSEKQLAQAAPAANVEYICASAHELPVPDASVDLVVVGQALHWFDHDLFFAEADRCLRPGGTLAVLGYGACSVRGAAAPVRKSAQSGGIADLWDSFYYKTLGSHATGGAGDPKNWWDCDRRFLDSGYDGLQLPFGAQERAWFDDEQTGSAPGRATSCCQFT